ncbi:hypothetical protein N7462_002314 [Penicillium macrosclerotiorum]|uniref:uncharacterized protein n=1 Tax=Penicillium macrosclerotiorum TaxID=303699 RepID=UPI0025471255|nr:uncharacterized protein N7462_002314 [Penicillium macrosclerotiorum]KAJ5692891.1 hypothetical protein N7462_002314 [Penicillium macrosclerotiorum]
MYERQRVWRACQACRRRKIKCDGEHPCQSCSRNKAECVYVEPHGNGRMVDPQYVLKLENRISLMEKRLKQQALDLNNRENGVAPTQPEINCIVESSHDQNDPNGQNGQNAPRYTHRHESAAAPDESAPPDPTTRSMPAPGPFSDAAVQTPELPSLPAAPYSPPVGESPLPLLDPLSLNNQNTEPNRADTIDVTQMSESLMEVLIDHFYHSIYPIFPVVSCHNFRRQYDRWLSTRQGGELNYADHDNSEFPLLLYALLAVAASVIPEDHVAFERSDLRVYRRVDLGDLLYRHAISISAYKPYQCNKNAAINAVASQGLLSLYLIEVGKVNDAWVTAGHAIRLYQGLDVEDEASTLHQIGDIGNSHSNLWWCLYILDRSLSTALLKPLAIDDAESDIESCDDEDHLQPILETRTDPWFSVIADFHITMGRIYRSVRWIRKFQPSQKTKSKDTLRSYVKRHDAELEKYYTKQVLPRIAASHQQVGPVALQTVAISSYYIGVVLLYRTFIERFNIAEPEAFLRCAEAASKCIKLTPQVIATVPASHFVIQQSRAIYASAKVLLHCMRLARNSSFTNRAWPDVEDGLNMLREIKIQWPEIKKYQLLTEEDMYMTQNDLNKHDMFYRTFNRYGQTGCVLVRPEDREIIHQDRTGQRRDQGGFLESMEHTNTQHKTDILDNRRLCMAHPEQPSKSRKQGRDHESLEGSSKRRKLIPTPSQAPTSSEIPLALDMLPILPDGSDFPMLDHLITTGDILPDISPRQSVSEDFSSNFFSDWRCDVNDFY